VDNLSNVFLNMSSKTVSEANYVFVVDVSPNRGPRCAFLTICVAQL